MRFATDSGTARVGSCVGLTRPEPLRSAAVPAGLGELTPPPPPPTIDATLLLLLLPAPAPLAESGLGVTTAARDGSTAAGGGVSAAVRFKMLTSAGWGVRGAGTRGAVSAAMDAIESSAGASVSPLDADVSGVAVGGATWPSSACHSPADWLCVTTACCWGWFDWASRRSGDITDAADSDAVSCGWRRQNTRHQERVINLQRRESTNNRDIVYAVGLIAITDDAPKVLAFQHLITSQGRLQLPEAAQEVR